MVSCIKIKKEKGEQTRKSLASKGLLDLSKKITRDKNFVYIPLKKSIAKKEALEFGKVVSRKIPPRKKQHKSLKEILKNKLSKEEVKKLKTSYDVFGEVAVIEIPKELDKKEKPIGNALLELHKGLRAVFKKAGEVKGTHRTRKLKLIAGSGSSETTYTENSCTYKFDVAKVFFTERLSTERQRIANQVKAGEVVLDMFAGVGPFSILIAKKQLKVNHIYAVDINKDAVFYLKQNIILNKVSNITALHGDATKLIDKKFKGKADRVIMNLPKSSRNFLKYAVKALKNKGILNFYTFAKTKEEVREKLKEKLKKYNFKILEIRKVKSYAPYKFTFAADIRINKKA